MDYLSIGEESANKGSDITDLLTVFTSLSLGIGLAAATGMRIFLPLFLAGIVLRFGMFSVSPDISSSQAWLSSNGALICFGVATFIEAAAYKLPFVDNFLDVLGAPAALVAGSVLATTFLVGIDDPLLKYGLGIVAGAGTAGVVHGTTAVARAVSTKTTGGIANPIFSLSEIFGSLITSILAFLAPIITAVLVVFSLVVGLFVVRKIYRRLNVSKIETVS